MSEFVKEPHAGASVTTVGLSSALEHLATGESPNVTGTPALFIEGAVRRSYDGETELAVVA